MTKEPARAEIGCFYCVSSITLCWLSLPFPASCSPPFLSPIWKRTFRHWRSFGLAKQHLSPANTSMHARTGKLTESYLDYGQCQRFSSDSPKVRVKQRKNKRRKIGEEERKGEEEEVGLTWTDGWWMECDWASCTYTRTAWLSNGWKLQLIKYGSECVKRNLDTCMCLYLPQQR